MLNTGVYGGKLYALPRDYESMHLFYNKDVFKQNGWKLPTNRAEFEQIADAALAKGIIPFGAGNADWKGVNEWLMTVFFNNVAGPDNVRKALSGDMPWTAPPFVEAVELSKAWYKKGYFGKNYFSLTIEQSFLQVVNGKAAMAFNGTWSFGTKSYGMSKPDTVMDVVPDSRSQSGRDVAAGASGVRRDALDREDLAECRRRCSRVRVHAVAEFLSEHQSRLARQVGTAGEGSPA